jgi:hypothetical protein
MLPAAENTALADYERTFGVRRIVAYTWAGPHVGPVDRVERGRWTADR